MSTLTIAAGGTVRMPVRPASRAALGGTRAVGTASHGRAGRPVAAAASHAPSVRLAPTARLAPAARPAPLHLTRRGRLLVVVLAVLAALAATLASSDAAASGPQSAPQVERYLVAPGDTLWDIAAGMAAPGEDLRDVIRELVLLNNLPSAGLTAGQLLVLPADR